MARVQVGDMEFPSKKEAKERFSQILNSAPFGEEFDSHHPLFLPLKNLVEMHLRAQFKIMAGIKSFEIGSTEFGTKGFFVNTTCGQKNDFSFIKCIDGEVSPFQNICKAARKAVKPFIIAFRASQQPFVCQITKEPILPFEAHADHFPIPFCVLVNKWLNEIKKHPALIKLDRNGFGPSFSDQTLEKSFFDFHSKNAQLRIIKKELNFSLAYQAKKALNLEQ